MDSSSKTDAHRFLQRFEQYLNSRLPSHVDMSRQVEALVKDAKASLDQRHKAFPEGAVLNEYIAPLAGRFLREGVGLDGERARQAILSESYRRLPLLASGTPARSAQHPFSKVIGVRPEQVIAQWKGRSGTPAIMRSCPDLAFRHPAPYRVVFEAKYFRTGSQERAEAELATGIYQAFFYRGLPEIPETPKRPAWDYEYACLLICDGSPEGNAVKAWKGIPQLVRKACWEGANVYVMVLRGVDATGPSQGAS